MLRMSLHQLRQGLVSGVPDQPCTGAHSSNKLPEYRHITFPGRKDIHMIPGNTRNNRDIGVVMHDFRSGIQGRTQILVAFDHTYRSIAEFDIPVKSIERSSYEVVEITSE